MKRYAGIGNRDIPPHKFNELSYIAYHKAKNNWILRSGKALGSDSAFEEGVDLAIRQGFVTEGAKEIFTPKSDIPEQAFIIAETYHPVWYRLNDYVKRLMARNAMIILGEDLETPVEEVICYAIDENKGGTSHSLKIAKAYDIPITNMAR